VGLVRGCLSVRDLEGLMGAVVVVSWGASMVVLGVVTQILLDPNQKPMHEEEIREA
jgi:hypothetical protein